MKKKAFYRDIIRTFKKNISRFVAIAVMATLGIGAFSGFAVGCLDIVRSADIFYDAQNNYDIQIVSTLGLTRDDLVAVSGVPDVRAVFGNTSLDVKATPAGGTSLFATLTTLDPEGMNQPYVWEGTLPTQSGQIAVDSKFIDDTGLHIGDTVALLETESQDISEDEPTTASDSEKDDEISLDLSVESASTKPTLAVRDSIITAVVQNPLDISNAEGGLAAVSFSDSKYTLYATPDCIKTDIYTTIYLTIEGASELDCYSEEYRQHIEKTFSLIQDMIQEKRQQARYDEVVGDAQTQISDSEKLLADEMVEPEEKLADAQKKIDEGWLSYHDGMAEIHTSEMELISGEKALNDAKKTADKELAAAQKDIDDGWINLNTGESTLNSQREAVLKQFTDDEQLIAENQRLLNTQKSGTDTQLTGMIVALPQEAQTAWNSQGALVIWAEMMTNGAKAAPYLLAMQQGDTPTQGQVDDYDAAMTGLQTNEGSLEALFISGGASLTSAEIASFSTFALTYGTINYSQSLLQEESAALAIQKPLVLRQLTAALDQITAGKAALTRGQKELDDNKALLAKKQVELEEGKKKLADAKEQLANAETELIHGQKELDENREKYEDSIAIAQGKLSDAKVKISEIGMAKWYVWDRSDNESFAGLDNDMSFIQAVTKAFPIIFFLVAVLICLTTMTRMVEEDRGLIGTYKSLGYRNSEISSKYIFYAVLACLIGGALGSLIGFIGLPLVIAKIFTSMYVMPLFQLHFYPLYAFGGFGLFLLGIAGATIISCGAMLRQRPAELMRPKAPRAGSRILLERLPFIWKRLDFLRKITCRNLFRYKKRALMTIVGILGCTMLIVLGFGLRDTVEGVMPDQFDTVTVYDAIVATDDLSGEPMSTLADEWTSAGKISSLLQLQLSSMTLRSLRDHMEITVMVIPDDADFHQYVRLEDVVTDKTMTLPSNGIVITKGAAKQLSLTNGDTASLLNEDNCQRDFPVAFVATNYASNYVFVKESVYQQAFGDYSGTSFLLNLADETAGQEWLASLQDDDRILTVNSSQAAIDTFNEINIDVVIYLLIAMSAVLALAVLFTLSNININERERELATIKVLGFQRKEVYSYVNKETVILSLIGILCGLPAGYGITYGIMGNLSIANIAFNVRVSPFAYLIATVLTLTFTLLVNRITNKGLRKINMVEALKSVE